MSSYGSCRCFKIAHCPPSPCVSSHTFISGMSKVFPMLGRELCSAARSALVALQSQVILAKPLVRNLLVHGLLSLMAVVQVVSLPVLFVIVWYPSNNNQRVVEAHCTWHMGEFGGHEGQRWQGWIKSPLCHHHGSDGCSAAGLLSPELAALLPPCRLEEKISPYRCPPQI